MPDDDSVIAQDCEQVKSGKWGSSGGIEERFKYYMFPVGTFTNQFSMGNTNEWLCDDDVTEQSIHATWLHFIK